MHGVLVDMMQTSGIDMSQTVDPNDIDAFLTNAAWAICATHHTVLQSMPGAAIFGWDMLFDIPYIADWNAMSGVLGTKLRGGGLSEAISIDNSNLFL